MAELLIWIEDQAPERHPLKAHTYLKGEVIAVCPDGWEWSERERTHPKWRLVKAPGVAANLLADLTIPRFAQVTGEIVLKRDQGIDVDALALPLRTRLLASQEITLSAGERTAFLAAKKQRTALVVIG